MFFFISFCVLLFCTFHMQNQLFLQIALFICSIFDMNITKKNLIMTKFHMTENIWVLKVLMKKSASWESVYLTMNWLKLSSTTQSRHHSHLLSWNLNLQNVSVSVPKSSQVKTSQDIFIPRIFRHALWHTISAGAKHFTAIHITPSCDRKCVHSNALSARMHKWTNERTNIRTNDALTDFYAHILIWLHSHAWR